MNYGKCVNCNTKIAERNFGYQIDAGLICSVCEQKHLLMLIDDLERFRKSKAFEDKQEVKKKILWLSEKMGYWFDNADGSIQESIGEYDQYNLFELQCQLLDQEITLIQNLDSKKKARLKKKINKILIQTLSYIDQGDFIKK